MKTSEELPESIKKNIVDMFNRLDVKSVNIIYPVETDATGLARKICESIKREDKNEGQ